MSFVILNTPEDVAALPDGTLITWLPVADDPSSEAVAFVRTAGTDRPCETWISPGNGWEPEGLDVLVFPVRVLIKEGWIASDVAGDGIIAQTLIGGGTYPRDVALQAAATAFAGNQHLSAQLIINFAETFAAWLLDSPTTAALDDLVNHGVVSPADHGPGDDQFPPIQWSDRDV